MSIGFTKCVVCGGTIGLDIGFGSGAFITKDGKKTCSESHRTQYNQSLLYGGGNSANASSSGSNSGSSSGVGSFLTNAMKSDEEKMAEQGLSGAEIAEIKRQKAADDLEHAKFAAEQAEIKRLREIEDKKARVAQANDLRAQGKTKQAFFVEHKPTLLIAAGVLVFFLIFGGVMLKQKLDDTNGAEISLKLEAIEDQVKLAIQSGDKEKALQLANQLVHPLHSEDKAQPSSLFGGHPMYDEEWSKKRQDYKDQIMAMGTKSNQPNDQPQSPEVKEQQPDEQGAESNQPEQATEPEQAKTTEQQPSQSMATIIADKAYFYEQPDLDKKRKGYLIKGQKVEITGDNGNFYNCTYTAENGMKTDAWMLKTDCQKQ